MAVMLSIFMGYLITVQALALDVGLGPGLSLKNAILYVFLLFIMMRYAVQRDFRLELGGIFGSFALLLGYAIVSTVVVVVFLQYPGYKIFTAMTQFKGLPFDFLAFFTVFFYGLKTRRDVNIVLTTILFVAVITNIVSGLDAVGIVPLATINKGETSDRVQGILGEHNQYGAFLVFFIPPLIAAVVSSRGLRRGFWLVGTLASFAVLVATISRGAFVGLFLAMIIGAWVFRSYLLRADVIGWLIGGTVVAGLVLTALMLTTHFGAEIKDRIFSQSRDIDIWQVSSGRSELWKDALEQMMRSPVSLVTGFGWATYFVLPSALPLAPHNTYLWYWFEIGIVGVLAFIAVLLQLIFVASRTAIDTATGRDRAILTGFAIGAMALAIAIFFVEIYTPWPYFWACAGVVMRLAMIIRAEQQTPRVVAPTQAESPVLADRFGWGVTSARRSGL
jgi:O-antigen ligase